MTWKDGSSDRNELHRELLCFAKFVFAACPQAFIGQYTFTKGYIDSVLVYSWLIQLHPNELCDLGEEI